MGNLYDKKIYIKEEQEKEESFTFKIRMRIDNKRGHRVYRSRLFTTAANKKVQN